VRQAIATPGIVLRRSAYGEADLVVTLLGQHTGRVSALARGARKSTKRFAGGLGMGMAGTASLRDRPGAELMMLESFEVSADRGGLTTDLAKTAHAGYALELCDRLCPSRHPEPKVFAWLETFLSRLDAGQATVERLRVFELGLLRWLGIGPSFDRCIACGRSDLRGEDVRFHADAGGIFCRSCARSGELMSSVTRDVLVQLDRASLADADEVHLAKDVSNHCRETMLSLLRQHIAGPLRSLEFIEKMSGSR
jgi:DNA repair protein RecO (recombination protein O)